MAESEGFEPPEGFPSTVFKTAAFDHSASSPDTRIYCKMDRFPTRLKRRRIINIYAYESSGIFIVGVLNFPFLATSSYASIFSQIILDVI